jgi:heme exporter protein D
VDPFPYQYSSAVAPHVWLELGARVIAIVVLLLIAQFVLERREIRA